jgi:hypothetical protein
MKKIIYFLLFVALILSEINKNSYGQPVINEFLASNGSINLDPDFFDFSDWIELYNPDSESINIGGYYLTDNLNNSTRWQIPENTIIAAGGYLIIWADGNNENLNGFHTDFQLKTNGEQIGLFNSAGVPVDTFTYEKQIFDVSLGRSLDNSSVWYFYAEPTPGGPNNTSGVSIPVRTSSPVFSGTSGLYNGSLQLELSTDSADALIYFTLDGSKPNITTNQYTEAIDLPITTVVRARVFQEGYLPSEDIVNTYFIDEEFALPVTSITSVPDYFWDNEIGIYVSGTNGIIGYCNSTPKNFNQPWERPANIELFEADGTLKLNQHFGTQIYGGCSRRWSQKSLAFYARNKYGNNEINYQLFNDKNINNFKTYVLRNAGNAWMASMCSDGLNQTIFHDRMDIDYQSYQPSVTFINGEYWGILNMREKINEHYVEDNHGVDPDNIDMLVAPWLAAVGDTILYAQLVDYIEANDMSLPATYEYVKSEVDINEFINYNIAQIFVGNTDWPDANIKLWRSKNEDGKWRWIVFDTDFGFALIYVSRNTLENATTTNGEYPEWSTFMLRKLLENELFKDEFIQRFAAHINTTFSSDRVIEVINDVYFMLLPEMARHKGKWSGTFQAWQSKMDGKRSFAEQRPNIVRQHINSRFNLNGTAEITTIIEPLNSGIIKINGVKMPDTEFSGPFYKNIPVRIEAVPKPGFRFAHWEGVPNPETDTSSFVLLNNIAVTAVFEAYSQEDPQLFINEFMADNESTFSDEAGEFDDWIEIYNPCNFAVDIGGLYITDDFNIPDKWQIPENQSNLTTIEPNGFLVLWADSQTEQGALHLNFKLDKAGEQIALTKIEDENVTVLDSVIFNQQSTDVSFGRNRDGYAYWQFFAIPTPDSTNSIPVVISDSVEAIAELNQNFPNPFDSETIIDFVIPETQYATLSVYDITGKLIVKLIDGSVNKGRHSLVWSANDNSGNPIPTGIYFYVLQTSDFSQTRKAVYISRR